MNALKKLSKLQSDLRIMEKVKQPRHYADEIMLLPTKEQRQSALEKVPEDMRSIVKFYLYDTWARRNKKPLKNLEAIQGE